MIKVAWYSFFWTISACISIRVLPSFPSSDQFEKFTSFWKGIEVLLNVFFFKVIDISTNERMNEWMNEWMNTFM